MKKISIIFAGLTLAISACTPVYETMTHGEAMAMCREQAVDAARVVSGNTTIGINSQTGPSFGAGIRINLTPRPQAQTYDACMTKLMANGQIVEGN
ncbi:MAG: hypothetical protein JKY31_02070 [Rhodobacteraceae bacterium]|nr:hypothetical protein [Paracoccaceae bacterium]